MNVATAIALIPDHFASSCVLPLLANCQALGPSCWCVSVFVVELGDSIVLVATAASHAEAFLHLGFN